MHRIIVSLRMNLWRRKETSLVICVCMDVNSWKLSWMTEGKCTTRSPMTDSKARTNNSSAIWVYLKAAEFRWFQQKSQGMYESNLVRKFRETGSGLASPLPIAQVYSRSSFSELLGKIWLAEYGPLQMYRKMHRRPESWLVWRCKKRSSWLCEARHSQY